MSTVTAVKKDGYIAIAADTLTKWGSEKNTAKYVVNHNKIIQLGENYIGVTGPAASQHAMKHYFSQQKSALKLRTIDEIYAAWRDLHEALKEEYHLESKDEDAAFESSHMDVIVINPAGIFAVGAHRDVQEFSSFYAYGAGNEYALGAMYAASHSQNSYSAEDLARIGVEASAEFDDSTGLPIISYMIKAEET